MTARRLLALPLAALASCAPAHCAPPAGPPPCATGVTVVVWDGQPTPCDLDGSQTLTVLGTSEQACADMGGRWWYEACEDRDY